MVAEALDRKAELEAAAQPLSAELEAVRDRLKEIRREEKRLAPKEVELYVALGGIVFELLNGGVIPYNEQTRYVSSGVLGCRAGTAYNARYAYRLHNEFGQSFAQLQNLGPRGWKSKFASLNNSGHSDRGNLAAERELNAVRFAEHLIRNQDRDKRNATATLLLRRPQIDLKTLIERVVDAARPPRPPLSEEEQSKGLSSFMCDSGAYSAEQLDVDISVDDYSDFIETNISSITHYMNLDVIVAPDPELAAQASFDNYMRMRERGLDPIAAVHLGENVDYWIPKYLQEGCTYIAFGGAASASDQQTWRFYDQCYRPIDKSGILVRTHAFGKAVPETLFRYKLTSCDATSWIKQAQENFFGDGEGYPLTDISRLGGKAWKESLTYHQKIAAATFLEALDANRLERLIQMERPEFKFYLGYLPGNKWAAPALLLAGHRNALVSYYYMRRPQHVAVVRDFIEEAETVSHREYRIALEEGWLDGLPAFPDFERTLMFPTRKGTRIEIDPYALLMDMQTRYINNQIARGLKRS